MKMLRMVLWLICFISPAWFAGCSRNANATSDTGAGGEKTRVCFNCVGTGKVPCLNGKAGWMDCPGPCLKLSQGLWQPLDIPDHPATDVYRKFPTANGGWLAWNQYHVGEVIEIQGGDPVNIGQCKVCGGTARVKCTVCNGTGLIDCPICQGKKVVPQSWTAFDNPRIKNRPEHFQLKDGRVLIGKKIMVLGDSITIRTETTNVTVKQSDIQTEQTPSPK